MADQRQTAQQPQSEQPANNPNLLTITRPGPADGELEPDQRRVLLVAAHPDDPEFSSGGTVANWVRGNSRLSS